jgi:hypothetical protein
MMRLIVNDADKTARGKNKKNSGAEKRKKIIRMLALFGAILIFVTFFISLFF